MESTRPIRALMRGLDALTVLNMRGGATVSEVVEEVRLPRTTVYRILQTLCDAGFASRHAADDRYRPTLRVRSLSCGFEDEAWVREIAKPLLEQTGREIVWPVSIATIQGLAMVLRHTTDHGSPLALERRAAGNRLPLIGSADGRTYLAFCAATERAALVALAEKCAREAPGARGTRPHARRDQGEGLRDQRPHTGSSRRDQPERACADRPGRAGLPERSVRRQGAAARGGNRSSFSQAAAMRG